MSKQNLNDSVIIYPTLSGWEKIIAVVKKNLTDDTEIVEQYIESKRTENGGFKEVFWKLITRYHELFEMGPPNLQSVHIHFHCDHVMGLKDPGHNPQDDPQEGICIKCGESPSPTNQ